MQTSKTVWKSFLGVAALALAMLVGGCEDSHDESEVRVLNLDDHNYTVRLMLADDDSVVAEKEVDIGETSTFHDVDDGRYYVTITRIGAGAIQDRSRSFGIDDDEDAYLTIDINGNLIY